MTHHHLGTGRELVALRNELQTTLASDVVAGVNWRTVSEVAGHATSRGWTGHELARWVLAELGGQLPDNPGAVIVSTLRDLAQMAPPRDATPTPPPVREVLLTGRQQPASNPTTWATKVREGIA